MWSDGKEKLYSCEDERRKGHDIVKYLLGHANPDRPYIFSYALYKKIEAMIAEYCESTKEVRSEEE